MVKVSTSTDINSAIKKQVKRSKTVKITGLNGQSNIGVGIETEKQLTFDGTAGDFFGALNNGAILNHKGNARRFIGDTMSRGGIIIKGNVQRGVGLAMSGGIIVIRGNVAGDVGQLMKGGTIIVSGNTGPRVGAFMFNGEIIVAGDTGKDIGLFMIGGTIYVGGKVGSLGINTKVSEIDETEKLKLKKYFEHYGITKKVDQFKKVIPLTKNPWKDLVFDLESIGEISKHEPILKKTELLQNRSELNEIIYKTKTSKLTLAGPNVQIPFTSKNVYNSYFDKLTILPAQTEPIKDLRIFESDIDTKVIIGKKLDTPLELALPYYISGRGPGIVSKSCKMAFVYASAKINTAINTGGYSVQEEIELNSKYGGKLIHQWNSGRLGANVDYLNQADAIEVLLGTGGTGSFTTFLPADKITTELSDSWHIPKEINILLPPRMFDIDVPADLKRHVELIREVTENKIPIIIKIATGNVYYDTKLALRAGPDAVVIEGSDGCSGNIPYITANNLGLPAIASIPSAKKAFKDTRSDKRGVKLIISGLFRNGADVFKALAMGADAVVISNSAEIAIGCKLCGNCNSNQCPEGIATTNPKLETKLDWVVSGKKLLNYLKNLNNELKLLMALTGYKNLNDFEKTCLSALDYDTAAITGLQLAGYDRTLPMWEH